ncbi:hypothetical protein BamMEX5DRAFT_6844 [Burkholderia ambifaria MEX-5]|uniref:Uncharacterized protein n=1 Tax=Burkholderia ambifaria MEX-5 TaxID=396597 RepID=B1TGC8_9BURK|nr:hypothetical protein BamMEX5DRAFT_6844 [Burkholderia ambifaria MEX-5]
MLGRTAQRIAKAREVHGERRQHVDAQRIACVARIGVRFVVDPRELTLRRVALQLGTQQSQERPHALDARAVGTIARRHRGQAGNPRAAQQLQQHGLGLIVRVLRDPEHRHAVTLAHCIERRIAALAGGRLDAEAAVARHVDTLRFERDTESLGRRLRMRNPRIGVRTQAVMHVQRDAARCASHAHGRIEQHRRVEAAAVRDRDARIGRQIGKRNADRIEYDAVGEEFGRGITRRTRAGRRAM